ncbi:MAG: hypothetical protein U0793_09615 [Gemmataceae bacterium]
MNRFLALTILTTVALAAPAADPDVTIDLGPRKAEATPSRAGFSHTGGGNIYVKAGGPDSVTVTMTGVAVAGGHPLKASVAAILFDLTQDFEVKVAKPEIKRVEIALDARLTGLLRSHRGGGSAGITCPAHAVIVPWGVGGAALVEVGFPARSVAGGDNLSINDRVGPVTAIVPPGKFTLHQVFGVQAAHPKCVLPCKAASAEFAPDPALDPLWISAFEPFHGVDKKDFGFQVTIRVAPANGK